MTDRDLIKGCCPDCDSPVEIDVDGTTYRYTGHTPEACRLGMRARIRILTELLQQAHERASRAEARAHRAACVAAGECNHCGGSGGNVWPDGSMRPCERCEGTGKL